jgi:hypothetical protein
MPHTNAARMQHSESWRGGAQEERDGRLLGMMTVQSVGRGGKSHADFGCFLEL